MQKIPLVFLLLSFTGVLAIQNLCSVVLTPHQAAVIVGRDPYECEECNSALVNVQCTGPVVYPNNPCQPTANPPVLNQTCNGSCLAIYCSGGAQKDRCSTSGFIPFHLCNCSMGTNNFTCGVKMIASPPCNDVWGNPGGGQPLVFLNCECSGNPVPTQVPCMDNAVDDYSTSCPGGSIIAFSYPKGAVRTALLASIR